MPRRIFASSTNGVLPTRSRIEWARLGGLVTDGSTCGCACGDLSFCTSPSGDGRYDSDLITVFNRCIQATEEADVVAVHVNVDEAAHPPLLIAQSFLDPRKFLLQVL